MPHRFELGAFEVLTLDVAASSRGSG